MAEELENNLADQSAEQATGNTQNPQPKKNVDYFGLKFHGNNDHDVRKLEMNDPSAKVTLMPKAQAYEHYKGVAEQAGAQWDPGSFDKMYSEAEKQYANYKRGMHDVAIDYDATFRRRHHGFASDVLSQDKWDPSFTGFNLLPEIDTRFVFEDGEPIRIKSDDDFIVNDLGWYVPITGGDDLSARFMYGEEAVNNRTYKDIELPDGRKMRVGDLKSDYDKFFGSFKLQSGPEGTTALAIKYDEKTGLPYAQEVSMYEKVQGDAIMSTFGPRKMQDTWYNNLWNSTITNTVAKIPQGMVGFLDWFDDSSDAIGEWITGDSSLNQDNYVDDSDTFYRNWGSWQQTKAPNEILEQGFADSPEAFAWSGGAALGSVLQMILTRKATGSFGKVFGTASGMDPKMASSFGNTLGAYMGSGTMAITAADGFKQSMIENGIEGKNQLLLYGGALLASFAVERYGSNILDDGLQAFYAKNNVKQYVDEGIEAMVRETGVSSASELTEQQLKQTGKNIFQNILQSSKSLGGKTYDLTKRGIGAISKYAPVSVKAAWEEGTEEVMEGLLYSGMETLSDMYNNYAYHDGKNIDRYNYVEVADPSGQGKTFYEVDKVTGIKRKVSESTYNKMVEGQAVQPGQGMFAEYNPELGFTSNYTQRAGNDIVENFVLGAFAGGVMGGASKLMGNVDPMKATVLQDYAVTGRGDEVRSEFAKMYSKGLFGPMDVAEDDTFIDPKNPEGKKSLNDIGYESALKELEEAETTARLIGITDGKLLKQMMESKTGKSLLYEAYDNVSTQRGLQKEIDGLQAEIEKSNDPQLAQNLQKEIDDKVRQKQDLTLQLEDIRSGQRLKENVATRVIKDWSEKNNQSMIAPDGSKVIPGIQEVKQFNDRFDKRRNDEIQKYKDNAQKKAQLENEVSTFEDFVKKDRFSNENSWAGDSSSFFERVGEIQKKSAEVGLSEAGTKNLMNGLESIRKDIISNFESNMSGLFDESEYESAKEMSEMTGQDVSEVLMDMATSKGEDTEAYKAYNFYNNLSKSIESFNVDEKPDVKVGELVQWTQGDSMMFDKPRKLEKISEDGKFGFVEGSDTGIPMEQLSSPEYTGRKIKGSVPTSFDEAEFKSNFYNTYLDTQGNEVSISNTISDLASRKMNNEDIRTLEMLSQAVKNNSYLASLNNKVLKPISEDSKKYYDLGNLRPSPEALLSDQEEKFVQRDLNDTLKLIEELRIRQKADVQNKKNREGKLRHNDYQIRNDIANFFSTADSVSIEAKNKINGLSAKLSELIDNVSEEYKSTKEYSRNLLDLIDPILTDMESIMHQELNGPHRDKIITEVSNMYRLYKGFTNHASIYHNANEFTMHDFDDVYDYNSFRSKMSEESAGKGIVKSAKFQFSNVYLTNHLQTIDRLDPKKFFEYYGATISGIDIEAGQVPSYEQVKAIYQTAAFMTNQKNDLLWKVQGILTGSKDINATASREMHFNRALFVRGFAGTGKTSLVIKYAANIYSDIKGDSLVIDTSAPSRQLQKSLNKSLETFRKNVGKPGMTFDELMNHIQSNSAIKTTDMIIIDEASNLNKNQLNDLKKALNNSGAKKNLSVIFLGDQSQMTSVNQGPGEYVAVERIMERTMPTTEVFRSGTADINNLQSAFRNSIFLKKEAILPKGTYDKEKNNGLHYFSGTKKEMYDQFVSDLNGDNDFKKDNTVLITYTKADREGALNYVRKQLNNAAMNLDDKIKTIEEGEFSAQGLEYGRVYVSIDEMDAKHLYNVAMLTAVTRAKKIDENNNGFVSMLSTNGYSEEGEPLIVDVKTASEEDIERHKSWVSSITGMSFDPKQESNQVASKSITEATDNDYASLKRNVSSILGKGKLEFVENGFEQDGLRFRYKIKNKPVQSVTQKLQSSIQNSSEPKTSTLDPHAKRGNAIHKIVEAYLNKQQKKGGKLFTKNDIAKIKEYIASYNDQVEKWNETATEKSLLKTISLDTDEAVFETNDFVQSIIANVAIPLSKQMTKNGKYTLPETIIGVYFNDTAGTIDILDLVGMQGSTPIVDVYDLKTLTPGSHKFFGDSDISTGKDTGVILSPTGDKYAASGLNKALSQLATYKAMLEKGDSETGLEPMIVRNATVIKSRIESDGTASELSDSDFVKYDTESESFKKFKDYGKSTLEKGIILQEKNKKIYDKKSDLLGSLITNSLGETFEVTGTYKDVAGNSWYELNGNTTSPLTEDEFNSLKLDSVNRGTLPDPNTQTESTLYKKSAENFGNGSSFSFGTASASVDNGNPGYSNEHFAFKVEYFKTLGKKIAGLNPQTPFAEIKYHPTLKLLNDNGQLEEFKNVVAAYISKSSMPDAVKAAKKMVWANSPTKLNDAQIEKEIIARGYNLISTLPNPDSDFGKTERDIDYTSDVAVQQLMEKIKNGFMVNGVADPFKGKLVDWHTHLAGLRAIGAKSDSEVIGEVTMKKIIPGSVVYGGNETSYSNFTNNLKSKGFNIGTPYFSSKLFSKTDATGKTTNVSSWAVDVWRISPDIDRSTVILRTGEFNDEHYADLKKSINDLKSNKAATPKDVNQSLAMIFLRQNRTFIIDSVSGQITSEIEGLNEFLKVDGYDIDLNFEGKATMSNLINSLSKAIDLLNTTRNDGNKISKNLRQAVPFTIGDNNLRVIPSGQESRLFTSAKDVRAFGVDLTTKAINTEIKTGVESGVTTPGRSREDLIKRMGKINPDPNSGFESGDGKVFMEEMDENTFAYEIPSESDSEVDPITGKGSELYYFAQKYFGDIQLINKIKRVVASNLILESNWNRDINSPSVSVSDMIFNTFDFYTDIANLIEQEAMAIDYEYKGVKYDSLEQISGETVHLLNETEFTNYFNYVIGKDNDLFIAIVDRILPNLDIKKMKRKDIMTSFTERLNDFIGAEPETVTEETIEERVVNENSQGSVMDSLDSRPITDTISAFVNLNINHVPLKVYSVDEINQRVLSKETNEFIDSKTIHKALVDAAQMSHWPKDDQWDLSKFDRWADNLYNIALDSGIGTPTYNTVMSFYDTFFSEDPAMMSHRYLRERSFKYGGTESDLEIRTNADPNIIETKGKASDNLLSALYAHFASVSSKKPIAIHTKGNFGEISYNQRTQSLAVGTLIAQNIKSRMNNSLFFINEDGIGIDEEISDKLMPGKNQIVSVDADGVYDVSSSEKKKIISFKTQGGRIVEFGIPNNVMPQEVKNLLNVLNMNELVYTSTVKEYMSNESDSNPDPEKRKDRAKLAEIVGMIMLTTKAAVDPSFYATQIIDNYYKDNAYTKDSLDEMNDDNTMEVSEVGKDLYKPTDLYRLIENLSKVQSDVQMYNHARHVRNINGDKVYRDTNGSTLHQMLSTGDISDVLPSSGIKSYFKNVVLSTENVPMLPFNSMVSKDMKVLNRIADPESGHEITDMFIMDGTKSPYKSAKQGSNMIDLDFADFIINGLFIEDILSGKKIQKVKIPFHLTSNKTWLPILEHNFGIKDLFKKTENGIEIDKQKRDQLITDIFVAHNNARISCYNRWGSFLRDDLGYPVDVETYNGWIKDPRSFAYYLSEVQKDMASKKIDLVAAVKRSNKLTDIKDYQISKGVLNAGKSTLMDIDSVYNFENMQRLINAAESQSALYDFNDNFNFSLSQDEVYNAIESKEESEEYKNKKYEQEFKKSGIKSKLTVTELIDNMFFQRNMDAAMQLNDIGFKLNKKISDRKNVSIVGKTSKGNNKWSVNPAIEAFLYAFHIADHHTSQLLMGDTTQYKNVSDVFKRSSGPVAPGWTPDTESPRGIGKTSKAVILEDIEGEVYQQLETVFGSKGNHTETDGLGIINPVSMAIMKNSVGGSELGVVGKGMMKPVYFKNNLLTNDSVYFKYALLEMTQQVLENSAIARQTFRKMVPMEIYQMWEQGTSIDDIANYVVENGLQSELLMQAIFKSGNKTGNTGIQNFFDEQWSPSITVDNEYFRIQLNAEQDVENPSLSTPTQLGGVVGVGKQNASRMDQINNIKAEIAIDAVANISKNFQDKNKGFNSSMFEDYLRKLGIKSSSKIGDITKFAEMLYDKEVDINIPTQRTKLIQQLMNMITSEAIKPRWNGVRMSQSPGFFFGLHYDNEGNVYMENEATKYGLNALPSRTLQPVKFYSDPEFLNEISSAEEFKSMADAGSVFVKPGEVIMPFSYFEQFGLSKYVAENKSFSLNDVFMIQLEDGNMVNLKTVPDNEENSELKNSLENIYASFKSKKESGEDVQMNTFLQREFSSASEAYNFIKNFKQALMVLPNRIPTSSSSFAWPGEIVGWINDNGNTIFTSAQKNILDGGDYDIDQLNVYFKFIEKDGKIAIGKSKEGRINEMFDLLIDYYNDPSNAEIYMKRLTLAKLESQVEEIKENQKRFKNAHNDFGTNLYYYDNIKQGDALIGIFANIVKSYSYLAHASASSVKISNTIEIDPDGKNSIGEYVSNVIERFLNAAMDNVKESILGYLGATEDSGNVIGAAAIKGMDEIEIANFLQNEVVIDVFKKIKYSKRVNNAKKLTVLDAIENKISDIEENNADDLRSEILSKLDEIKAKLSMNIEDIAVDNIVKDEYGRDMILNGRQVYEAQNSIYQNWDSEKTRLETLLSNTDSMDELKQDQLDVLYRFKDLAMLGEAVSRFNTIVKIDSQGIPVFDYQIDKLIRDIEFNLGMPLDEFLSGGNPSAEWYKSRRAYLNNEDQQKFDERESVIRANIDIPSVVRSLPHIMAYLDSLSQTKQWMKDTFIRNSKVTEDLTSLFLSKMKMDWFQSEQSYYSFHKEMDKFLVATYFATEFKDKKFKSMTGITQGSMSVNVSTPEGRAQFGFEFPSRVMSMVNEINQKTDDQLNDQELSLKKNRFLKSLTINSTASGDFLEFKNAMKLTEDDYKDLRSSFKLLPEGIRNEFHIYQLAKDGFTFTKGGLYEAMDNEMFQSYSRFLDAIKNGISVYSNSGKDFQMEITDKDGYTKPIPFIQTLEDIFLNDVGFYSDDMSVLPWYNEEKAGTDLEPEQSKTYDKSLGKSKFRVMKVKQKGVESLLQGVTKRTFNAYDPMESKLKNANVLRKISNDAYRKLKKGNKITIKYSGETSYKMGDLLHIFDGSIVKVVGIDSKKRNSIEVIPVASVDPYKLYMAETNKSKLLEMVGRTSKNELYKNLAIHYSENVDSSYFKKGNVSFTNATKDSTFEKNPSALGYWDSNDRNIAINTDKVINSEKFEQAFLHEVTHDIAYNALNMTDDQISKMGEKGDAVREFKEDIGKIFNAAKSLAEKDGVDFYGLKNEDEFVSEAMTNPKFQKWLASKPAEESVGIVGVLTDLYNSFIGSIKRLLGLSSNDASYSMLDQVIGVTGRYMNDGDVTIQRSETDGTKIFFQETDVKPEVEVNGTKDIIANLQPPGFAKNFSQYKEEQLVNDIYNSIDSKSKTYYYNGEKFFFKTPGGEMMDEITAKQKIKDEVLPKFTEFETNYKTTVIDWLNSGAQTEGSVPASYFPKKGGNSRYSPAVLSEMRRLMDYDVNDVYMRYSQLKDSSEFKDIPHIEAFEGYDPIIVIHKSIDENNKSISIFDATSLRLSKRGILHGNIFKKYLENDYDARAMGVNLGNNEGDNRRLLLGLQAMAMKKANPDLKIKNIGVLGVSSKNVDSAFVYMNEFMDNARVMTTIDPLKSSLPQSILEVIEDQAVYKDTYDQPWIFMLKRKFQEKAQDLTDIEGQEYNLKKTNDAVTQIESYLNGEGSKSQVLQMMISRMEELQNHFNEDDLLRDSEYIYLSNSIKELSEVPSLEKNSTKDLDKIKSFFGPVPDIGHDIINWVQEKILDGTNTVQDRIRNFQVDKFFPQLRSYNERYFKDHPEQRALDYLQDLSGKKFSKLFKTRTVRDMNGNNVEVNSLEIHWDMNDSDTQEAIKKGQIYPSDVEFGKFVVDSLEDQMIENLMHLNRFTKGYKKEDAIAELDRKWRKGMIPAMSTSVNEMIMKKDPKSVKAGLNKFFNQISNIDDIFDEVDKKKMKDTKRQKILKEMTDFFMNQIGSDSDVYGSDSRMNLMGLKNDIVGPVLIDADVNSNLSTNLELIVMYMVASSERKRHFDKNVLPYVNSAQTMLHAPEISRIDPNQEIAKKYLQNYINSVLKGMPDTLDSKINVGGIEVDVEKTLSIAVQLASFNGLALNVPVAITSGLMNSNQFMNNAIANDFAMNGLYGKKEAGKAVQMFGTKDGRQFIEAVIDMYKIADRSERDLVHNPRMKVTNKNIFNSHHAYWLNWYTDYNIRGMVAVAQMMKDGTISAYSIDKSSGKLVYDETKDPTWNGKDGEILKQNMKKRLIEDGYMTSMDEKMPRGYDNKTSRVLKHLADKYIIGNIDDATKGMFGRVTAAKPWMQFASFLPNKLINYFGSNKYSPVLGKYTVKENEAGEPEVMFEKAVQEGIFQTFGNLFSELRTNKYKSMRSWSEMQPHERYNVTKFGMDMIMMAVYFGIYAGLTADRDDEKKGIQSAMSDSRFMRIFKYAALDFLVWNPLNFAETLSSIPTLEQAERLAGIFVGDFSGVERSLPLSTTVRSFTEVLSDNEK